VFIVGRKDDMLSKVEIGEKREKLRGEVIRRIIVTNVKVASDDGFMRECRAQRLHPLNQTS